MKTPTKQSEYLNFFKKIWIENKKRTKLCVSIFQINKWRRIKREEKKEIEEDKFLEL